MVAIAAGVLTGFTVTFIANMGKYESIFVGILAIIAYYGYLIVFFRLFLRIFPLPTGYIEKDSRLETIYHIYLLFFIIGFYPLMRSGFLPFPLVRLLYKSLGAQMGDNSFTGGIIHDPIFVKIGKNCNLGQGSLLVPHQIEGDKLSHEPIIIGDNCTIGALSIVLQDVKIGNNCVIAAAAVIKKGTTIPDNEIWGGVPAKFIKRNEFQG